MEPGTYIGNSPNLTGTAAGGMKMAQECIDFMAKHNLEVKTEIIHSISELKLAEEKLIKGNDTGLRYVIDIGKALE